MKRAAKTTALVLAVTLLSSCSSSPKATEKQEIKTECEIAVEKSLELTEKATEVINTKGREAAQADYLYWAFYTLEKSDCFSSDVIAAAKTIISLYQK